MSLLENLHIPTLPKQRVPVKTLIEQLQPTPENKRLIESHVASIYLVSLLNEQTIRYRAYKDADYSYQVIYVLQIALKKEEQLADLTNQLHATFPEPTLLLLEHGDNEWISVAPKRINKLDPTKTVLEDNVIQKIKTDFIQYLNLGQIQAIDLKDYYKKVVQLIYKLGVLDLVNIYPNTNLDYKSIIKEYQQLQMNINNLKEQYKRASMKSEKMDIDDQIYDEEQKQKKLIKQLKGGIANG
jgi:hypothetical protein